MSQTAKRRRVKWWRDGTITNGDWGETEIDLTNGQDWITVKGASDARSEKLARNLLKLLDPDGDGAGA